MIDRRLRLLVAAVVVIAACTGSGADSTAEQGGAPAGASPRSARDAAGTSALGTRLTDSFGALLWARIPDDIEDGVFGPLGGGHQQIYGVTATSSGFVAVGVDAIDGDQPAVWISSDGVSWDRVPNDGRTFGGGFMLDVTAGGPDLVAVGQRAGIDELSDAAVWTSPDGITWSPVDDQAEALGGAGSQRIETVIAAGPGFVAVGSDETDGAVWTSTDGRAWSRVPDPDGVLGGPGDQRIEDIVARPGGLVAVGGDSDETQGDIAVWLSSNGLDWTRVPTDEALAPGTGQIALGVAAGGPGLVMVGLAEYRDSSVAAVWTSPDGLAWTRVPHDGSVFGGENGSAMTAVSAWDRGLVAVGQDNAFDGSPDAAAWFSLDGLTWSKAPYDFDTFGGLFAPYDSQYMLDVTVGDDLIVGVGVEGPFSEARAAIWAAATSDTLVAVGLPVPGPDEPINGIVATSASGWKRIELESEIARGPWLGGLMITDVIGGGPGLIAVGTEFVGEAAAVAAVWTSEDGLDWTRIAHHETFSITEAELMTAIARHGEGFAAVGMQASEDPARFNEEADGAVWLSPDGLNWTRVVSDPAVFGGAGAQGLVDVAQGGPGLVAVGTDGRGGAIWTSVDGVVWQQIQDPVFGRRVAAVAAVGPNTVAVGQDDDEPAVWVSADGLDWRPVELPPSEERDGFGPFSEWMTAVAPAPNGFVATGSTFRSAVVWTSPDALTWERIPDVSERFDRGMDLITSDGSRSAAAGVAEEGDYSLTILLSEDSTVWESVPFDERVFAPANAILLPGGIAFGPHGSVVVVGTELDGSRATGVIWVGPPTD